MHEREVKGRSVGDRTGAGKAGLTSHVTGRERKRQIYSNASCNVRLSYELPSGIPLERNGTVTDR